MSADLKKNLLDGKQSFNNETYKQAIVLQDLDINDGISFTNCKFKDITEFHKINSTSGGIYFYECLFEKGLKIKDCILNDILIDGGGSEKFIEIIDSKTFSLSFMRLKAKSIHLRGIYKYLNFANLKTDNLTILEINNIHNKAMSIIRFDEENKIDKVKLNSESIYSEIYFDSGVFNTITLEGGFKRNLHFKSGLIVENLILESSIFQGRVDFSGGTFEHIYFYRSNFSGQVLINNYDIMIKDWNDLNIENISFHSNEFKQNVSLTLKSLGTIDLSNNNFKQIFTFTSNSSNNSLHTHLSIAGTNQGNIIIEETTLGRIDLSGINLATLIFKQIKVYDLTIDNFKNNGNISLFDIEGNGCFVIDNSSIGNVECLNTDPNSFQEVIICNSNISGLEFSTYPNKILSYSRNPKTGYGIKDKSKDNSNLKDIYNQLKKTAKNKGDIDTYTKFKSLEYNNLRKGKKIGFDRLLLSLNTLSNKNGQSWSRGLLFTIIIGLVCFWFYSLSLNIHYDIYSLLENYVIFVSSFPKLGLESNPSKDYDWLTSLIILFSRILIAYGAYQTVSAFRKYGKG